MSGYGRTIRRREQDMEARAKSMRDADKVNDMKMVVEFTDGKEVNHRYELSAQDHSNVFVGTADGSEGVNVELFLEVLHMIQTWRNFKREIEVQFRGDDDMDNGRLQQLLTYSVKENIEAQLIFDNNNKCNLNKVNLMAPISGTTEVGTERVSITCDLEANFVELSTYKGNGHNRTKI